MSSLHTQRSAWLRGFPVAGLDNTGYNVTGSGGVQGGEGKSCENAGCKDEPGGSNTLIDDTYTVDDVWQQLYWDNRKWFTNYSLNAQYEAEAKAAHCDAAPPHDMGARREMAWSRICCCYDPGTNEDPRSVCPLEEPCHGRNISEWDPVAQRSICRSCASGTYSDSQKGAIACVVDCPAGRYADVSLRTCVDCPANTFSSGQVGAVGVEECRNCPDPKHSFSGPGSHECLSKNVGPGWVLGQPMETCSETCAAYSSPGQGNAKYQVKEEDNVEGTPAHADFVCNSNALRRLSAEDVATIGRLMLRIAVSGRDPPLVAFSQGRGKNIRAKPWALPSDDDDLYSDGPYQGIVREGPNNVMKDDDMFGSAVDEDGERTLFNNGPAMAGLRGYCPGGLSDPNFACDETHTQESSREDNGCTQYARSDDLPDYRVMPFTYIGADGKMQVVYNVDAPSLKEMKSGSRVGLMLKAHALDEGSMNSFQGEFVSINQHDGLENDANAELPEIYKLQDFASCDILLSAFNRGATQKEEEELVYSGSDPFVETTDPRWIKLVKEVVSEGGDRLVFTFDEGSGVYPTGIDPTRIGPGQYQQFLGQCFGPATEFERRAYNYEFDFYYRHGAHGNPNVTKEQPGTHKDSFLFGVKEKKVCPLVNDPDESSRHRWNVGNLYTSSAPANIGNRICCCAVDGMEDIACATSSKCDTGKTLNVENTPSSLDDCTKCEGESQGKGGRGGSTVSRKPNTVVCDTCPSAKSSWQRTPFGDETSEYENRAQCLFSAEELQLSILSTITFWSLVAAGVSPFAMILLVVVCCSPRVAKCKREAAAAAAAGEEDHDATDVDEADAALPEGYLPGVHCCFCYFFCHAIGLRVAPCCAHSNGAVDDDEHDLSCIAIAEAAQKESEGLVLRTHGDHHQHHDVDSHLVPLCGTSSVVQESHGGVGLLFHDIVRVTRVLAFQAVFLSIPLMVMSYLLNQRACPEECAPTPSNWAGGISATTPLVTFFYLTTTVETITTAFSQLSQVGGPGPGVVIPGQDTCYKNYGGYIWKEGGGESEDGGNRNFLDGRTKDTMEAVQILAFISAILPFLLFVLQAMRARVQWRNSQRSFDTVAQHTLTFRVRNVRDTEALGAAAIADAFSTWGKVAQVVVHHAYDAEFAALSREYAALANEPEYGSGRMRYEERLEDAATQLKERKAQLTIACEGIIAGARGGEAAASPAAAAPPILLKDDAALNADAIPAVTSGGESNVFVSFERAVDAQNCFDVLSGDAERCAMENENGAAALPRNLLPNRELRLIAPAAAPADIVWDNILDGASAFTVPPDHTSCSIRCKGCVLTSLRYTAAVGLIILTIVCLAISTTGFVAFSQLKVEADSSKCGDTTNVLAVDGVLAFRVAATAASAFADIVKYLFRQYVLAYVIGFLRPATRTGGELAKMVIVCTVELLHICLVFAIAWTLMQSKTHALYCRGSAMAGPEQMCNAFEQFTTVTRFFYFCFSSQITSAIAIVLEELFTPKIWARRVLCACCFRGKKSPREIRLLWRSDPPALWVLHAHIVQTVFLTLIASVAYPAASIAGLFKLMMLLFFLRISLLRVRPAPPQIGPAVYTLTKSLYVAVAMVACVFNILFSSALDGQMTEFVIDIALQTESYASGSTSDIIALGFTPGQTELTSYHVLSEVFPYPTMMEERYLRGMPRVTLQSSMIWILATIACALIITSCVVCSLRCSRRRARVANKLNIVCCAISQSAVCVGMTLLLIVPMAFACVWSIGIHDPENIPFRNIIEHFDKPATGRLLRTRGEFVKAMGIVGPGVDDQAYFVNLVAIFLVTYVGSCLFPFLDYSPISFSLHHLRNTVSALTSHLCVLPPRLRSVSLLGSVEPLRRSSLRARAPSHAAARCSVPCPLTASLRHASSCWARSLPPSHSSSRVTRL